MNNYLNILTSISSDTLIIIAWVGLFLFIGLRFGKGYITAVIASIYISAFLYTNAFFVSNLIFVGNQAHKLFWNRLGILLLFFVPIFYLLKNIISGDYGKGGKLMGAILLAIASTGLIIALFYHLIPVNAVYNFSTGIDNLFSSEKMLTIWLLLPFLVLFI